MHAYKYIQYIHTVYTCSTLILKYITCTYAHALDHSFSHMHARAQNTHIFPHICTSAQKFPRAHSPTQIQKSIYLNICIHAHTHAHTRIYTQTHAHTHTRTHTCTHTHTHTHTHAHKHAHSGASGKVW